MTTDEYNSRKQMLKDYAPMEHAGSLEEVKAIAKEYDVPFSELSFYPLAVSIGIYGVNGAVISAYISNPDIDTQFTFSIESRSAFLLQMI